MIHDAAVRAEVSQSWATVRKMSSAIHRTALIPGQGFIAETRPLDSYNLPLLLAYAVLDQVLNELIAQGAFSCNSWKLGEKMGASRPHLPWQDYSTVHLGKEARNRLAHDAILLPKPDCLRYIDALERELQHWGVL